MSEPFAPDPLDTENVSLPAEIQGERLHVISLMTPLPGNSFGPLALLYVYAGSTDTVTRVPVDLDFGVDPACSAAARLLLACPSRDSPSSASCCLAFLFYEAFPHAEVRRLRIHVSCGSALPSSGPTSAFLSSSMCARYMYGGGRMCFPVRNCRCRPVSLPMFLRFCLFVPRSLFLSGRPDVSSRPRLCALGSRLPKQKSSAPLQGGGFSSAALEGSAALPSGAVPRTVQRAPTQEPALQKKAKRFPSWCPGLPVPGLSWFRVSGSPALPLRFPVCFCSA